MWCSALPFWVVKWAACWGSPLFEDFSRFSFLGFFSFFTFRNGWEALFRKWVILGIFSAISYWRYSLRQGLLTFKDNTTEKFVLCSKLILRSADVFTQMASDNHCVIGQNIKVGVVIVEKQWIVWSNSCFFYLEKTNKKNCPCSCKICNGL